MIRFLVAYLLQVPDHGLLLHAQLITSFESQKVANVWSKLGRFFTITITLTSI